MNVFSSRLGRITHTDVERFVSASRSCALTGRLPKYIPSFARANPQWFAVQIDTPLSQTVSVGDIHVTFSLMSVVKPFLLLYALEYCGQDWVFRTVGTQPSDLPFNSLLQLQMDQGFPRNPMLNSGAIALCSLFPGQNGSERCDRFRHWLNHQAGASLSLDHGTLASVKSLPNEQNRAIAQFLGDAGQLHCPVSDVIDTYERVCCLAGTVVDLSLLGLALAQPRATVRMHHCRIVTALMTTCGLYEASSRFALDVGLPSKSGVSGAILSVLPREGAIACYSPPLDAIGNSSGGMYFLQQLSQQFNLSVFG
ncbi:MAG: glutaminase A [Cyanobacteria bacterium P01_E01_bin.6]